MWDPVRRRILKRALAFPGRLYLEYRDQASSPFTGLAAYTDRLQVTLAPEGGTGTPATAAVVTGNYFDLLGVGAAHGRMIGRDDDQTGGGNDVVVLSNRYWVREFGARTDAIGEKLRINGTTLFDCWCDAKRFFRNWTESYS